MHMHEYDVRNIIMDICRGEVLIFPSSLQLHSRVIHSTSDWLSLQEGMH